MATSDVADGDDVSRSRCWCCGLTDSPERLVRLGRHPEVALCLRCARWAAKQAQEIEDGGRTGLGVIVRDRLRTGRRWVIDKGWHHNRFVGGPLRWLGKHLP